MVSIPKAFEGTFDGEGDVFRAAVEAGGAGAVVLAGEVEAELGGDDQIFAEGGEGRTEEFFIGEGAVDFEPVSKKVMPRSTAAWRRAVISVMSLGEDRRRRTCPCSPGRGSPGDLEAFAEGAGLHGDILSVEGGNP